MGIQDRDYIGKRRNDDEPPNGNVIFLWWLIGIAFLVTLVNSNFIDKKSSNNHTTDQRHPEVVNVNNASLAELDALPHISETIAQEIIDGRPYSSIEDLIRVYGIGPKTLEAIRPYLKINDEHPQP